MIRLILLFLFSINLLFSFNSVFAQSFLSDVDPLAEQLELMADSSSDQVSVDDLKPLVESSSENQLVDATSDTLQVEFQEQLQPQLTLFNQEALDTIAEMMEQGEFNQALDSLENLPMTVEGFFDGFREPELKEERLYLTILGNYRIANHSKVIALSKTYFGAYIEGKHDYWVYYFNAVSRAALNVDFEFVYPVNKKHLLSLPNAERSTLRTLLIEDSISKQQYLTAMFLLEDEEGALVEGYERWIDDIVENINHIEDIDQVVENFKNQNLFYQLQLRKVQLMIRDGMLEQADEYYYSLFLTADAESTDYNSLAKIYDVISMAYDANPAKIGVILPFSHPSFKRYAREVLDGLELSLSGLTVDGKAVELVLRDSAQKDLTPEYKSQTRKEQRSIKENLVKAHVKDLVENEGVIAILGPLARNTSQAAGEAGERYKVPIISFSLTENIGSEFSSLFRFQRSQYQEAKTLADYAVDYLNASRFVLFYRSGAKSFELMQTFAKRVRAKGGEIVGIAKISKKMVDFNDVFKSFTGGFKIRSEEELEELKLTRQRPKSFVDFDAIYLPADVRTVKVVSDFAKLFDAGKVWVLSGSEINVRENHLLTSSQRIRFVDTYPVSHMKTFLQPFFESHWKHFNHRPRYYAPTSYTIYGYEALEIIGKLLQEPNNRNREALRDVLRNLENAEVLTGLVGSEAGGELNKQLKILKIQKNDTVSVF